MQSYYAYITTVLHQDTWLNDFFKVENLHSRKMQLIRTPHETARFNATTCMYATTTF